MSRKSRKSRKSRTHNAKSKSYWRPRPPRRGHRNRGGDQCRAFPAQDYFPDFDQFPDFDRPMPAPRPIPPEYAAVIRVARTIKAEQAALPRSWQGEKMTAPGDMFTRPAWWYEQIEARGQRWSKMLHDACPDFDSLPVDVQADIVEGWR